MAQRSNSFAFQGTLIALGAVAIGIYFTFHAVQGDFGLFSRLQIEAEEKLLIAELDILRAELEVLQNKTKRLSDDFLDLDLLDERARDVLGVMRPEEIALQ